MSKGAGCLLRKVQAGRMERNTNPTFPCKHLPCLLSKRSTPDSGKLDAIEYDGGEEFDDFSQRSFFS